MTDFGSEKIKIVLKTLLKNQKKTFEQLADHLDCSVPTVKRILGKEDLSLTRLLRICEFLDISLTDIETLTKEMKTEKFKLTIEQSDFLLSNLGHFAFFMGLCSTDQSAEDIANKNKLNRPSLEKYLLDLENLGLIRVNGLDARPTTSGTPELGAQLASHFYEGMIGNVCKFYTEWIRVLEEKRSKSQKQLPSCVFSTLGVELSQESFIEWQRDQSLRLEELERRSSFEKKAYPKDQLRQVVITSASAATNHDEPLLEILADIWGSIPNIR